MKDYFISGFDATDRLVGELRVKYGKRTTLTRRKAKKRLKRIAGASRFQYSSAA